MKANLLLVTLPMLFASPLVSAKSELEILRSKCLEQERQIQQLELENSRLRNDPPARTPAPASAKPSGVPSSLTPAASSETYTVKAGDSLERIAKNLGTTPASLARQNGLKPTAMIHPGQTLKFQKSTDPAARTTRVPATVAGKPNAYTIKVGDTFSSISRSQKISVAKLIAANPNTKPTALRTGQVIRLGTRANTTTPVAAASAPRAPAASLASAPARSVIQSDRPQTRAAVPTPPPQVNPAPLKQTVAETETKIDTVTIDGEINYGDFAAKHGTDIARLNALNGLDLNNATVLAKGSELYVPRLQP